MFLHFLWQLRKRKHYSLWTEVLQFIWWVTSGLTPEEQEHIRKSKDPSVVMAASGTAHTTEEATVYVYDLDMFSKFNCWRITRRIFAWNNVRRKRWWDVNGVQVSHHISLGMGKHRVQNRQPLSLSCPWRASNRPPGQSSGRPKANERRAETELPDWL